MLVPNGERLFILIIVVIGFCACTKSSDTYLQEFYRWNGTEQTAADPLIAAGDDIVPKLLVEIANPEMPNRMTAIYFLSDYGHRDAIPVLERIILNEQEHEAHRSGTLHALAKLDWISGQRLAERYEDRSDQIGNTARNLLTSGIPSTRKRSYRAAYLSFITNGAIQIEEP